MLKNNSKEQYGFAVLGIILAAVVILLIGVVGWYLYSSNRTDSVTSSSEVEQNNSETEEIDDPDLNNEERSQEIDDVDTSSWKRENVSSGVSFKHPERFTPFVSCENANWVYARYESNADPNFDSNAVVDKRECHGFGDIVLFSIEAFQADGTSKRGVSAPSKINGTESEFTTANGTTGVRVCNDEDSKPFPDAPTVTRHCQYIIKAGYMQLWGTYQQLEGTKDNLRTVDAVMSSLDFK